MSSPGGRCMIHDAGRERQKKKTPASASTLRRGEKGRLVRPRTPAATVLAFLSLRAALCESLRMSMCVRESVCVRACCSCVCLCVYVCAASVCICVSPFVPLSRSVHNYFNTHTHTHTHTQGHRCNAEGGFSKERPIGGASPLDCVSSLLVHHRAWCRM